MIVHVDVHVNEHDLLSGHALLVRHATGWSGDFAAGLLLGAVGVGVAGNLGGHPATRGDHGAKAERGGDEATHAVIRPMVPVDLLRAPGESG